MRGKLMLRTLNGGFTIQGVSKLNGKTSGSDSSYREKKKSV
jgi:hypothetical protein